MVGSGKGAKNGVMFKTAVSLEETGKVQIVALDKTGTITSGEPKVTDVIPDSKIAREELLEIAYALEKKSEHPLAKAILLEAERQKVRAEEVSDFQDTSGKWSDSQPSWKPPLWWKYEIYLRNLQNLRETETPGGSTGRRWKDAAVFEKKDRCSV